MPKRTDLKKIMIIGSGPIVIGQAAEFDYAGTQAGSDLIVLQKNSGREALRTSWEEEFMQTADNGDGIPPQLLGVLFDGYLPLGAVEASDRSRHMGIGLSVCRAIVRAHGGEIYARNRVGGGAEFRFWLPAEEGHT